MEKETNGRIPFLDTLIKHNENGTLTTTVYRKATHTDRYLDFRSNNPMSHKRATVTSLYNRATLVCSDEEAKNEELAHIETAL